MANKRKKTPVTFENALVALVDNSRPFSPRYLHCFSDISSNEIEALNKIWLKIHVERRITLLEDLEELAETDTVVAFHEVARLAICDPDGRARTIAIRLLWESDDDSLPPVFAKMMLEDSEEIVRAQAATSLGFYIYLGELELFAAIPLHKIEDVLLKVLTGSDSPLVRRRALESLGYSSREEIPSLIKEATNKADPQWLASAIFAMGRSADVQWEEVVLENLDHPDPDVQLEAIRTAGQLELESCRDLLLTKIEDTQDMDIDLRAAAIWSLSQIGGEGVREGLDRLYEETEDDDEAAYIEDALDNLVFTEEENGLALLGLPVDEDNLLDTIIDVDEYKEDDKNGKPSRYKKKQD